MSWIGIVIVVVGLYLALKVAGLPLTLVTRRVTVCVPGRLLAMPGRALPTV